MRSPTHYVLTTDPPPSSLDIVFCPHQTRQEREEVRAYLVTHLAVFARVDPQARDWYLHRCAWRN
jgi:hypothetical protein